MPFKKTDSQGSQPPTDTRKLFIGRTGELLFFVQNILKPEEPTHNIISIWGQGGVGKSTLLSRLLDEAGSADFKDFCLTATVDERQTTPTSIMEKFADHLHIKGEFEKALKHYKEALHRRQTEPATMQHAVLSRVPAFAGAAGEMTPVIGPLVREGAKATAELILDKRQIIQGHREAEILEDPLDDLTRAFVEELNRLTDAQQVSLWSSRVKKQRVILCFDTFEQLAAEATPWLLNYFLPSDINSTVVLVIAGRDPIERSIPDETKRWLPYCDNETIYWIPLNSFTEDETRAYLVKREITDPDRITTLWQLSQGLPLYLSLLTTNLQGKVDPTKDVVDNFLRWIPEHEQVKRRLALDAALFSRPFHQDELGAFTYLSEPDRPSLYRWLIAQPFVRSNLQDGRYNYHELAQELFGRHLYQLSPSAYYATRTALAEYYQRELKHAETVGGKDAYATPQWLELTLALAYQLFLLPDETNHLKATEQVLNAYEHTEPEQKGEIGRMLRELSKNAPSMQVSEGARQIMVQFLHYLDSDSSQPELLQAANFLIGKVTHDPSFPRKLLASLYQRRGGIFYALGKYEEALADGSRSMELDPDSALYYVNRGMTYLQLKRYEEALAAFNRALELGPNYGWCYYQRGNLFSTLNKYEEALADYNQAIDLDPNKGTYTASYYYQRGNLCSTLGKYEQALTDYSRAIDLDPKKEWYHAERGWTYFQLEKYDEALIDSNRAIELDVNNAAYYDLHGDICYALEQYEQALADSNRAIKLDPTQAWYYFKRGQTYFQLEQYEQALADYNLAIELDHDNAVYYAHRGAIYLQLEQYEEALADCNRALELDANNAEYYANRGRAYLQLKKYEQALADYSRALALDSHLDWAYAGRGLTYLWLRNRAQAIMDYTQSWELNQKNVYTGWMAEWSRMCQEGITRDITQRLETLIEIDPQCYEARVCRGVLLWLQKGFEQAISLEQRPWDAYFWDGLVEASLGRDEDAIADVKKALEIGLPPVLLTPLRWLEQERVDFCEKYVKPLFARYELAV